MSSSPDTVVFDLGNVLLDWDPRRLYRKLIDDVAEVDAFLATICTPQWHYAADLGGSLSEATQSLQAQHPDRAELIAAFYGRWTEMLGGALPATVDVLRELRDAGIRLLALTNWPAETFPPSGNAYAFVEWFEGVVVSGHEGIAKPDPAIFALLLERYGVDPARAVYIDDTPGHVEAAGRAGLAGLVYRDAARLRRDLAAAGLPVRADIDIRPARTDDLAALTDIYNHFVTETAATFDIEPKTVEQRRSWFEQFSADGPYRLLVATRDEAVVGYASSSRFRPKPAYDRSVEVTTYLHPDEGGRGIASMLYQQLFADLRGLDLHRAYAAVAQPNPASVALHRRFGFHDVGVMREVGRKHGRWWDVLLMERPLP